MYLVKEPYKFKINRCIGKLLSYFYLDKKNQHNN